MKTIEKFKLAFMFVGWGYILAGLISEIKACYFIAVGIALIVLILNTYDLIVSKRKPKNIIEADFSKRKCTRVQERESFQR